MGTCIQTQQSHAISPGKQRWDLNIYTNNIFYWKKCSKIYVIIASWEAHPNWRRMEETNVKITMSPCRSHTWCPIISTISIKRNLQKYIYTATHSHMRSPMLHRYRFSNSSALCWFIMFDTWKYVNNHKNVRCYYYY